MRTEKSLYNGKKCSEGRAGIGKERKKLMAGKMRGLKMAGSGWVRFNGMAEWRGAV